MSQCFYLNYGRRNNKLALRHFNWIESVICHLQSEVALWGSMSFFSVFVWYMYPQIRDGLSVPRSAEKSFGIRNAVERVRSSPAGWAITAAAAGKLCLMY